MSWESRTDRRRPPTETFVDIRYYLTVLKRRKVILAVAMAVGVLGGVAYWYATAATYVGRAEVLVEPMNDNPFVASVPRLNLDTERQLVVSTGVARLAQQLMHTGERPQALVQHVSVSVPSEAQALDVLFSDHDPSRAEQGANAFAEAYLRIRAEQAVADSERVADAVEGRVETLQKQVAKQNRILAGSVLGAVERRNAGSRLNALQGEISVLRGQLALASTRSPYPGRIILPASRPSTPQNPTLPVLAFVGLVLGAFAGILFAFLRDRLDKRLRSRQEVEAATGSLLLGVVPATNGSKRDSAHRLVTLDTEEDGAAEAYRALRANLLAVAGQEAGRILMVTSPLADEGKTTVVANLAVAMAQLDRRVVVVSADLREPTLHRLFQLRSGPGLAEVLAGRVDSVRSVVKQPKVPHLWVVSSGKPAKRPAESLHSERMRQVLDELRREADFVILDCPPVLPVSDCLALAPLVDGVLVVVDPRTTTRDALVRACQDLELVGGRLIGTVVNKYVARTGGFVPRYDRYGGRRPYPHSPSSNGGGRKQARKEREARPIQAT